MASKQCKITECKSQSQHMTDGMCKRHFTASQKSLVAKEIPIQSGAEKVIAHVEKAAAVQVKERIELPDLPIDGELFTVPAGFGLVTNAEDDEVLFGTGAVIVAALRESWATKEAEWLVALSGLKPGQAIVRAASMVLALEGLGY